MALPAVRGSVLHHVVVFQRPVRSTLFPLRIAEVFGRPEFHRCTMNCWTFNCQLLVNAVLGQVKCYFTGNATYRELVAAEVGFHATAGEEVFRTLWRMRLISP